MQWLMVLYAVLCPSQLAPTRTDSILTAMRHVRNPRIACELLYQQIKSLTAEIRTKMVSQPNSEQHMDI